MENKTIADLVKEAKAKVAGGIASSEELMKTAHAQGIEDSERLTKIAAYTGDILGNQAYDIFHGRFAASLGFDLEDEVVKEASIQDMLTVCMADCLEKIAENYSPQTGGANLVSTQQAAADQVREAGKGHATIAVQAAQDALASVAQGDPNTAIQSMNTAAQNITLAQQATSVVDDPELSSQVAEASQIVAQAAASIQSQG